MKRANQFVWIAGILAIVMVCLFPYSRYIVLLDGGLIPLNVPGPDGKEMMAKTSNFRFESGFRPIWINSDPLHMQHPHVNFGLGIQWPVLVAMIVAMVISTWAASRFMRSRQRYDSPSP